MRVPRLIVFGFLVAGVLGYAGYRAWHGDELAGLDALSPASIERKVVEDDFTKNKFEVRKLTFTGESVQKSREYLDTHLTGEKLRCTESDDIFAVYKDPKLNENGHEFYWFYLDQDAPTSVVLERTPISEARSRVTSALRSLSSPESEATTSSTFTISGPSLLTASKIKRSTQDLMTAVRLNDLGEVKKALAAGGDPNEADSPFEESSLLRACSRDDLTIARYLLQHGGKANTSLDGKPIVVIAAARGYIEGARLLLENGARLSRSDSQPLVDCSSVSSPNDHLNLLIDEGSMWVDGRQWRLADQAVKLLIDQGVPVNGREPITKQTALHKAAESGHARIVTALLEHGADPMIWDSEKKYPIDIAREYKRNNWRQVVELLDAAMKKASGQ